MKKKLITIAAVGCFALLTAAYTFFSTETNQANSLMLENIEALALSETSTSYSCAGTVGSCHFRCGVCGTEIGPSIGTLTGSHSCNLH